MSTREFDLGCPRSKEPCIYTQGNLYLHVKIYTKWYGKHTSYDIKNQAIEAFRRNVWGTIEWQDRSNCAITDSDG
jgi:hypothetical protein